MGVVLQKYLAQAGHCSRRRAEELIRAGRVEVNGKVAELGARAGENDEVRIGGLIIKAQAEKIYIIMNKPVGYVCSNRRFRDEQNVFDLLVDGQGQRLKQKLFVVGRLDKMSAGLVLLTNDGDLAYKLSHPRYGHEKEYVVKISNFPAQGWSASGGQLPIFKKLLNDLISKFLKGVKDGDDVLKAKKVEYLEGGKFRIVLVEGKNRQIRRMFAFFGLDVLKLQRVRIGSGDLKLELGRLKTGEWKCVDLGW